ncbi:BRO family protein [Paraburkholderia sediminicola]|uniref:BRO family protein n=1 Tax=Paraburkholderia sediminicola TaxID=458836 RepID=UPI0038B85AC7
MTNHSFDKIKQVSEMNAEFWSTRELQPLLEYATWDKFKRVIEKASEACERSGHRVDDHFSQVGKMVILGSGAQRTVEDFRLSRYACYLVVQNGDPSKPVIANGQTSFSAQHKPKKNSGVMAYTASSKPIKRTSKLAAKSATRSAS